jgi:quercetin dioxygenase-like cupin family protein
MTKAGARQRQAKGGNMATIFNESTIAAEPAEHGTARQHLLTDARVPGTRLLLDRLTLASGGEARVAVPARGLAWFQILEGEAVLTHDGERQTLTDAHVVFLPPGYSATLSSSRGATFLMSEIPDAASLDSGLIKTPPEFRVVDWTREPMLDSEHDARKRIYLVTPKLFGTKAVKGEMIIYPPGTAAANHHHVGAEHFMYVLRGHGTVYANEKPFPVRQGDVIYYPDLERHYLKAAPDAELVFAEYFAPGEFKTIWVNESEICTWHPTGRDIRGRTPAREIKAHSSADVLSPQDV